jgi:hypothetical protein
MINFVRSYSKVFYAELLAMALFCLFIASCDLPSGWGDEKGALTIILPGANVPGQNPAALAVHLPEPITGNMSYSLDFYKSGESVPSRSIGPTPQKAVTVELEPGYWDIGITAWYGSARAAADKKTYVEIQAGQTNSVSFTMNANDFITPDISGLENQDITISTSDPPKILSITLKTSTAFTSINGWTDNFSYQWYYVDEDGISDYDSLVLFSGPPGGTVSPDPSYKVDPLSIGTGTFRYYMEITNKFIYVSPEDGTTTTGAAAKTVHVARVEVGGSPLSYSVGGTGPGGGTVFYYDPAGFTSNGAPCHYLEAALTTYPSTAGWGASGTVIGATGTGIGTGYANTQIIVTALSGLESGTAAQLAWDHSEGGQSDWFLPSKDELGELYTSGVVPNLIGGSIWSSSEFDAAEAWYAGDFSPPVGYGQDPKINTLGIHPIRAF